MHPSQASSFLAPWAPHSSKVTFAEVLSCPPRSEEGLLPSPPLTTTSPQFLVSRASLCPSPSHARVSWHVGTLTTVHVHSASLSPEFSHKPRWLLLPSVSPLAPPFTPLLDLEALPLPLFPGPCLSLHQPNPYYPGPPTDIWNTPFHPSCPKDLHNFLPHPAFPHHLPAKGTEHTLNSSAGASNSHHSLHPGPPSLQVSPLKPFLCFKGQLSLMLRVLRNKVAPEPAAP